MIFWWYVSASYTVSFQINCILFNIKVYICIQSQVTNFTLLKTFTTNTNKKFFIYIVSLLHVILILFIYLAANITASGGHGDQQVSGNKESTPAPEGGPKPQREGKPRNPRPPQSRRTNDKPKEALVNGTTA